MTESCLPSKKLNLFTETIHYCSSWSVFKAEVGRFHLFGRVKKGKGSFNEVRVIVGMAKSCGNLDKKISKIL